MTNLYGIEYGLGKMFEGITGGAVRDKEYQLKERQILNQEDQMKMQRITSGLNAYLNALKVTNDPEFAKSVYAAINPGEEIPNLTINKLNDEMSINWQGIQIKGYPDAIQQAIEIMSKNPESSIDIMQQLSMLGLAEITMPQNETRTIQRGKETFTEEYDPISGKWKEIAKGPKWEEKGEGIKKPKVTDYVAGIKTIYGKYKIDAGLGLTMDKEGKITGFDLERFMAGKQTAYNIISQKAQAGDAEAQRDLDTLRFYYEKIENALGREQTVNKPTFGNMAAQINPAVGTGTLSAEDQQLLKIYTRLRDSGIGPQEAETLARAELERTKTLPRYNIQ